MKTDTNEVSSALNLYYEGTPIRGIQRHLLQEFNHSPSLATIYEWIQKYTQYAKDSMKDYHPQAGDIWVADETVLNIDGQQLWLFDLIDYKTRMILSTRLSRSRTTRDAQMLMDRAVKVAGKQPRVVITDKLPSYLDVAYGKDTEHRQGKIATKQEDNTQVIERFHGTLKSRTKVMKGLKNFESALDFLDGWLVHYNYFRPHMSLDDKTPAQVAGINFPFRNWKDITEQPYEKTARIKITPRPALGILPKVPPISPKIKRLN